MNLREYIDKYGVNIAKLSRKAKVTPATLYNIMNWKDVRLSIAVRVQKATEDEVTCEDMVNKDLI